MHPRLLSLLLMSIAGTITAVGQTPDAVVETVVGKGLVKSQVESKPEQLKKGQGLFAGQWVSCQTGCEQLIISYCNVPRPIKGNPKWRQILAINCKPPQGMRGGAKGHIRMFSSPIESEVVLPSSFSLKWDRSAVPREFEVSLRIMDGERIWGPYKVDGRKGSFSSASLRAALQTAQQAGASRLELSVMNGPEPGETIEFNVVSTANEVELERKLQQFNSEPDAIIKAIARASVFGEFGLTGAEVTEIEQAYALANKFKVSDLTRNGVRDLTVLANKRAGNTARVRELESH